MFLLTKFMYSIEVAMQVLNHFCSKIKGLILSFLLIPFVRLSITIFAGLDKLLLYDMDLALAIILIEVTIKEMNSSADFISEDLSGLVTVHTLSSYYYTECKPISFISVANLSPWIKLNFALAWEIKNDNDNLFVHC